MIFPLRSRTRPFTSRLRDYHSKSLWLVPVRQGYIRPNKKDHTSILFLICYFCRIPRLPASGVICRLSPRHLFFRRRQKMLANKECKRISSELPTCRSTSPFMLRWTFSHCTYLARWPVPFQSGFRRWMLRIMDSNPSFRLYLIFRTTPKQIFAMLFFLWQHGFSYDNMQCMSAYPVTRISDEFCIASNDSFRRCFKWSKILGKFFISYYLLATKFGLLSFVLDLS